MQARFWTAALLGFVLITVSACGGSSGVTEEERLREQLQEAEETVAETEERLRAEEEARKKAEAAAEEERKKAERAAEAEEEAEQAREDAEQAEQDAEQAREDAEQAREDAEQQQEQLQQQLTDAERAELSARASSFGTHLDAPARGSATVTWPRGESLTFRPAGTLAPGSAAPGVPGSWRSAGFTGQTGTAASLVDETVYLYANIREPGTRAFWKVHGLNEAMTVNLALLARASSASPDSGDTDGTTDGRQYTGLTISGTLNGAGGKFTCSTCGGTVGSDSDGIDTHVTFAQGVPTFGTAGSWTFTPSNISNGYRVDSDDAYLYFGIWSSIPESISATAAYDFEYIAGGGAESGPSLENFDDLVGPATFRGGAVGRYVTQGQVGQQNARIGTFTATATLNADFSDADTPGTQWPHHRLP